MGVASRAGVVGLDLGGAHVKAAHVGAGGEVTRALQVPCPLWRGLGELDRALGEILRELPEPARLAVTMTGELADLFPDRSNGVRALVARVRDLGRPALVWAGGAGFLDVEGALARAAEVASQNWLATARVVAGRTPEALLVDIGSTTTDLVPITGGRVRHRGETDRDRLAEEELVYLGVTRTMLMAVAGEVPFAGRRVGVMREYFATLADVFRVLGSLPDGADQHDAADGGPKTEEASARRLARMIGADLADGSPEDWRRLAAVFARMAEDVVLRGVERVLSRGLLGDRAPLVAAGSGAFLAARLAARLGRPCRRFSDLVEAHPQARAGLDTAAPAVSVALLASSA